MDLLMEDLRLNPHRYLSIFGRKDKLPKLSGSDVERIREAYPPKTDAMSIASIVFLLVFSPPHGGSRATCNASAATSCWAAMWTAPTAPRSVGR
jgi:hypothetical protein